MNETDRRQAVRDRLRDGRLPRQRPPAKILASRSNGETCDGCGQAIETTTIEYEVALDGRVVRVHVRCFDIWRDEFD